MKWIAIVLNVILIATIIYLSATKGGPDKESMFIFVLILAAPVFSIVALSLKVSQSWLWLYFKRKALEEKQKIEKLNGHKN